VGVVDTGVDAAHPALAGRVIEQVTRRSAGRAAAGTAHGTAVVALLASALGPAPILVVDAFHRRPDGDAADAFDVAAALSLLAMRGITVANLSFAGPANEVLALATERAASQGMLLAAAAGNDGPRSPPRFPAAYPWVVAVTAVDAARRPFVRAVRGNHLAFAARGVGLPAQGPGGARLSGTSYAVPFVTAAFAIAMAVEDRDAALLRLAASAEDLGTPGRDAVFGWGLIRPDVTCRDGLTRRANAAVPDR
jgi:subtilisin family serine protease